MLHATTPKPRGKKKEPHSVQTLIMLYFRVQLLTVVIRNHRPNSCTLLRHVEPWRRKSHRWSSNWRSCTTPNFKLTRRLVFITRRANTPGESRVAIAQQRRRGAAAWNSPRWIRRTSFRQRPTLQARGSPQKRHVPLKNTSHQW